MSLETAAKAKKSNGRRRLQMRELPPGVVFEWGMQDSYGSHRQFRLSEIGGVLRLEESIRDAWILCQIDPTHDALMCGMAAVAKRLCATEKAVMFFREQLAAKEGR